MVNGWVVFPKPLSLLVLNGIPCPSLGPLAPTHQIQPVSTHQTLPRRPPTGHTYRRRLLYNVDISSFRCTSPTPYPSHVAILTDSSLGHANPFPNL